MHFCFRRTWAAWIASLVLHVAAAFWLVNAEKPARAAAPRTVVAFSVVARRVEATPPPPLRSPPSPRKLVHVPPRAVAPAPKPDDAPPAAAPAAQTLTGVTLTASTAGSFDTMTGNGLPMDAPIEPTVIAPPRPKTSGDTNPRPAANAGKADDLMDLRELGRKPQPPALGAELLAHYPPAARRQGLAGKARILARIEADGAVRQTRVLNESSAGFGAACQQTLLGSRWTPPRDKTGRAVPTQIHYTCDFRVDS